ncbi:MAG: hypothetical protein QW179_02895 [Candidatus Hadarchaeales archaeon]
MQVRVNLSYISAERFLRQEQAGPSQIHVSTNVNLVGLEKKDNEVHVPFIVTIGYNPSVAQINLKGEAVISGNPEELNEIHQNYKSKKPPPGMLLQAITSASLVEATIVSRSLSIPPPLPLPSIQEPPKQQEKEQLSYVG